jgi:hypothetical protein
MRQRVERTGGFRKVLGLGLVPTFAIPILQSANPPKSATIGIWSFQTLAGPCDFPDLFWSVTVENKSIGADINYLPNFSFVLAYFNKL